MNRTLWLILGAAAVGLAILPLRDRDAQLKPASLPAEQLPEVRIRHEFISIPASSPFALSPWARLRLAPVRPRPADAVRAEAEDEQEDVEPAALTRRRAARLVEHDATLFERARRAFVGDGRHRPEPFPRPRGNN